MKFKIFEDYFPPTKQLTKAQVAKLLKTDYSEALKAQPIYRGIYEYEYKGAILVTPDPKKHRVSAHSDYNYYTLIMNNTEAWKAFPKRQTICSTSIRRVERAYSNDNTGPFVVYPKNGAKIGICPEEDIFDEGFDDINNAIGLMFWKVAKYSLGDSSYSSFLNACKALDKNKSKITGKIKEQIEGWFDEDPLLNDYINMNIPFLDFVQQEWITPKRGFKVLPINRFKAGNNNEVWTDAPTLMIPERKLEEYLNEI